MKDLANRDQTTLVELNLNDRRRLAVTEVVMQVEDGVPFSPIMFGQAILHNALLDDEEFNDLDVLVLGDKVARRLFA